MKLLWKLEVCRMVEVSDLEAAMDLGGHMQIYVQSFFRQVQMLLELLSGFSIIIRIGS